MDAVAFFLAEHGDVRGLVDEVVLQGMSEEANRSRAWLLSFVIWHAAEHLLGGAVCVRRMSGIPLGL